MAASYEPYQDADVYEGEGAEIKYVQGLEFWIVGKPAQLHRDLGIVHITVAPLSSRLPAELTDKDFFDVVEAMVAKDALKAGGNAVVLRSALKDPKGTTHLDYRVIAYSPEGARVDGPVLHDPTIKDADGNKVPNGIGTDVRTIQAADAAEENVDFLEGTALANVCVGADGAVGDVTIVQSSGHKELDALALKSARTSKYLPATVHDRPIAHCKYIRYTWQGRR